MASLIGLRPHGFHGFQGLAEDARDLSDASRIALRCCLLGLKTFTFPTRPGLAFGCGAAVDIDAA